MSTSDTTASSGALARLRRPPITAGLAAAALVVLAAAGQLAPEATGGAVPPTTEPLASAELVCGGDYGARTTVATVSAAVVPVPEVGQGRATLASLTTQASAAKSTVLASSGATASRTSVGVPGLPLLAQARGSFAAGLGADQQLLALGGVGRGLALAPCTAPVSDTWLVGGAATVGRFTRVLLTNDDDRPAQVDLDIFGPAGAASSPATTGLVVPASSRLEVRLDAVVPGLRATAVHVIARSGRISALGLDQSQNGLVPQGTTYLSPTAPGTRLVIPEVPGTSGTSRLLLLAPDADASVSVRMITADGTLTPVGLGSIDLQAGRLLSVDLAKAAAGEDVGLLITSDAPVVAGAEVTIGERRKFRESDAVAAVPMLRDPALVTGLSDKVSTTIVVSAPAKAATVRLQLFLSGSTTPTWTRTMRIDAGSQAQQDVPVGAGVSDAMLVVTPVGGGPVYAARLAGVTRPDGSMISTAPLLPHRATAEVPGVASVPGSSVR